MTHAMCFHAAPSRKNPRIAQWSFATSCPLTHSAAGMSCHPTDAAVIVVWLLCLRWNRHTVNTQSIHNHMMTDATATRATSPVSFSSSGWVHVAVAFIARACLATGKRKSMNDRTAAESVVAAVHTSNHTGCQDSIHCHDVATHDGLGSFGVFE